MPLFMDFHDLDDFSDTTIQELKKGHLLDLAVQAKYDVHYKHYYVSPDNRKAFCVMEGPDKEACEAVHREAHGFVACNIVEVELTKYGAIMGVAKCDPEGMHLHADGTIDSGLRTVLLVNTLMSSSDQHVDSAGISRHFADYSILVKEVLSLHGGRELSAGRNETIFAFTSCFDAIRCSAVLQDRIHQMNEVLKKNNLRFETTVAVNAGEPVTRNRDFFGDTLLLARRLSHTGKDGEIVVSSRVNEHAQPAGLKSLKITGVEDERFISRIMDVLESRIKDDTFSVVEFSERAGMSRPQLYRRIHNIFGQSPNHLINELRLREASRLIHKKFGNISQIAYEVGYNNPSYFAKCFAKRFGFLPSQYSMRELQPT